MYLMDFDDLDFDGSCFPIFKCHGFGVSPDVWTNPDAKLSRSISHWMLRES